MRAAGLYQIIDEPRPGARGQMVSQPFVPLLSFMFVGTFLAWPWFVFNAFALGSYRRWRDLAWAGGGFLVRTALVVAMIWAFGAFHIEQRYLGLARLVVTLWTLTVTYRLYLSQQEPAELYETYRGPLGTRGLLVMIAAAIAVPSLGWYSSPFFVLFFR